jgi:predicted RNA binding protein YcfA (HicA-like mRNA interferase family)
MSLPVVSGLEVIRAPLRAGLVEVRQRGSHVHLRHADGRGVTVPVHRELAPGTLRSVLRQAQLGADDLRRLL